MRVEKLLNNGCGMGRYADGRVLFVPGALAGDEVAPIELELRKGVSWARKWELRSPSPDRVEPGCVHHADCGGCALLHLARERELEAKVSYFLDTLTRIAKVEPPQIQAFDFPLRNSRVRGKLHVDAKAIIGFKEQAGSRVQAIHGCQVLPSVVLASLPYWSELLGRVGFQGEFYFSTDSRAEEACFEFQLPQSWQGRLFSALNGLPPGVKGLLLQDPARPAARKSLGIPRQEYEWLFNRVSLEPSQFLQSNPATWTHFWQFVHEWREQHGLMKIWDAHAGSGFLSAAIATAELVASEPEPRAVACMERSKQEHALPWRIWQGSAESLLASKNGWLAGLEAVLLDPPRTGLEPEFLKWLAEKGPEHLLYVSCDMGSFARDWNKLQKRYRLDGSIRVLNPNPGTLKLESLARFVRR